MKVQISIRSLLKESFALFKENILILLGLIFGGIVLGLLLTIPGTFNIGGTPGMIVSNLVSMVFQIFFTGIVIKYCLQAIKGYDPGFKEILPSVSQCLKLFGYSLLTTILYIPYFIVIVGSMLPGTGFDVPVWAKGVAAVYSLFIFSLIIFKFWAVTYLILDKDYGLIESFKTSWEISKGNKFSVLKLILVALLLVILGIIALLIGVFVAMAFLCILATLFYTKVATQLTGSEVMNPEEE